MKAVPWIIAGMGVGLATYFFLNRSGPEYVAGSDDVDGAAEKAVAWGTKRRIFGAGHSVAGKLKTRLGEVIGDDNLSAQGAAEQIGGAIENSSGQAAQVIGQTIHDLNH